MLFVVCLRLQLKLLFFVHERYFVDVISSEAAATSLDLSVLLLFLFNDGFLEVIEAVPEKPFERLSYLLLRYFSLSIFIEQIYHRLCHSIALNLLVDTILVFEDINCISSKLLKLGREDPVEHLVNQFHHLNILRLEEPLETAPLQRL